MNSYSERIKHGERDLKNKAYFSAVENFKEAPSVIGLVKVINTLEKVNTQNEISAKLFALNTYKELTGEQL